MGMDVQKIESQNTISRYDLARLLNIVECKDCINPNQDMIKKYVQNFWSAFGSWRDFGDINYLGGIYNSASYYYCVAYVGDNTYMRGYPKATSPICGGKFCGTNNTTTAEFIQVIINILSKYIYQDIIVDRKSIHNRLQKVQKNSYEDKNFSTSDKQTIEQKSKICENTCRGENKSEVAIYLKYCMFNIQKCSMQEIGKIKQWYRPIAELNMLYTQKIINIEENTRKSIDKLIDGKTVIETLYKVYGKINCTFDNDYDCDGIENTKDSCPNAYNPRQIDTDKDGIGDVCDDDIDGDGIKNPIGIVDDEGNIDISKRTKETDNCLFIVNTNQIDSNQNGIWDACEENQTQPIGIYIHIKNIEGIAPVTTQLEAITTDNVETINRDFWDGSQWVGTSISHTFLNPGMYHIKAIAKNKTNQAHAQTTIIIGGEKWDNATLQARATTIGGNIDYENTLSTIHIGTFDEIERIFHKENIKTKKQPGTTIKKIFTSTWEHTITIKWYKNTKLLGVSRFTIGIGSWQWALLRSNTSQAEIKEKILFDTYTYNIQQNDILYVDWDFGDTKKKNNSTLTTEHTYTKEGKKVVTQTISLKNGKKITNIITIYIVDTSNLWSYGLSMVPSKIISDIGSNINYSYQIIGKKIKNTLISIIELGDGTIKKNIPIQNTKNTTTHTYKKNGKILPQSSMFIDQCTYIKNQATIVIQGSDMCLQAKINNTLKNYKCDRDGDGIPDICDTDIDGDGIPNLLGIINFENPDCSYDENNVNKQILNKHYQWICSLDNAPFHYNSDQLDVNLDNIGDAQQIEIHTNNEEIQDSDGDGIPDNQDLCPHIQETRNGIDDEDWCPEVWIELWCNPISPLVDISNDDLIIQPTLCNQCPCQFADFSNDIHKNDEIRALLRNQEKTILYRFSHTRIVDF